MASVSGVSGQILRSFIERVENLEERKKEIADDIREVFAEAKSAGFDPKIMRQVIKIRKMDSNDREEQEYLLDTYMRAIEGRIEEESAA
ncbi:MAG: DUF2312 domain-containing protein [Pseudomonadota bacterium]